LSAIRPDIAFVVNLLYQDSAVLPPNGTEDMGLFLQKKNNLTLEGYTDVGYLLGPHKALSQIGYVFLY
jgi:hypothetical protein